MKTTSRLRSCRSLGIVFGGALLACALAVGCGDDEDDDGGGGRAGSSGSGGRGGSSGSGGTGGLAGSGGNGGNAGQDASAGSGGDGGGAGGQGGIDGDSGDASSETVFEVRRSTLGDVVAANGRTLYFFGGDVPGGADATPDAAASSATPQANCTTGCLPPFYSASFSVRNGLARRDITEFTRGDSQMQLAYKGWPIYTSSSDTLPGQTSSDGMGKLWHAVATPFYSVVIRSSTVTEQRDAGVAPYSYTYLADGKGLSLYMFWDDTPAADGGAPVSGCSGRCLNRWPPMEVGDLKVVSSLSRSDFDILTWTPDYGDAGPPSGQIDQLVYKDWPMYYWWRDYAPGQTYGHCVRKWSLAQIDGDFTDC